MDLLQQQRLREEKILSLFGSIEDRELLRSAPGDPVGLNQFTSPGEQADLPASDTGPGGHAVARAPVRSADAVAGAAPSLVTTQLAGVVNVKRKRGRPPKHAAALNGPSNALVPPSSELRKQVEEEEDVCFICFDGGTLVLCDRKDCPKAYHPACIKRDESFFHSRAKWMCGWHLCSTCGKGAYYMCYACTYSLCKNCTKDADYVCVRGTKGLCGTCMKTIMLIENIPQKNLQMVQVDFDDKTSWEYLFKVYWVYLKEKLSLNIDELTQAKSPWIEPTLAIPSEELNGAISYSNGDRRYGPGSSNLYQSMHVLRGRKAKELPKIINNEARSEVNHDEHSSTSQEAKWASKELLDFVAHMRNGDTSVVSQFDVQALLLEYITKNNLRDTKRGCQIVCDSRLLSLFGKTVLGHFEMLKLLNSHFVGRNRGINSLNRDNQPLLINKKRSRTTKKVDDKVSQVNPDDCAAADAHNISLIFLRRNMIEKLLRDPEKFHEKIVGSIVRIKVSGGNQNQEFYRLVQVVGMSREAEPNKVGDGIAGIVLEIMNLDQKELMPIDEISNEEFSEDECGKLHQRIKCGQIKWMTVGELQQKALKLQELRVNECLEAELLRLNHLHVQASEKGHQKELRECEEKIQLLSSPEEHQRRVQAIPGVHADRSLDPTHISQDDTSASDQKKQDGPVRLRNGRGRKRRLQVPAHGRNDVPNKRRNTSRRNQPAASGSGRESSGLTHETNKRSCLNPAVSVVCALRSPISKSESTSGLASEVSPSPLSTGTDQSVNDAEICNVWHYQDPTGKTRGPFTMAQLRQWKESGHFRTGLRIWRIDERQEDSILLTEALNGNYNQQEPRISSNDRKINLNGLGNASPTQRDINIAGGSPSGKEEDPRPPKLNSEGAKVVEDLTSSEGRIITAAEVWDSLNDDGHLSHVQPQRQPCSSIQLLSNQDETSLQGNESQESGQGSGNLRLFGIIEDAPSANKGQERNERQSNGDEHSDQLLGQNWNSQDPGTATVSLDKSLETVQQNRVINFAAAPSDIVRPQNEGVDSRAEQEGQSLSSNLIAREPASTWSSAPSLVAEATQAKGVTDRWGDGYPSVPSKSVDEWDCTLRSGTSRLTAMAGNSSMLTSNAQPTTMGSSQTHHPLPIESSWQAIMNETNDFASLGEESVSDLLAQVEAMENAGLPSPTSAMKFGHDLNNDSKDDCFSPIDGFDPTPGLVKCEVFTSTVDMVVTSQPTVATDIQLNAASNGDLADTRRTSHKHSSSSTEPERDGKQQSGGNSRNQWKSGLSSELPRLSPPQTTWELPGTSPNPWGTVQGSSHWEGMNHSHTTNMDLEARQGQYQRTGSFSSSSGSGSPGIWSNQQRYGNGSSRYSSPRGRAFQGTDQGYGRNSRGPWSGCGGSSSSRQYSGGGGYRQQPPKGQRVCKFYESGYCKRGASCSYFHP